MFGLKPSKDIQHALEFGPKVSLIQQAIPVAKTHGKIGGVWQKMVRPLVTSTSLAKTTFRFTPSYGLP
jgi:hypothetical protein